MILLENGIGTVSNNYSNNNCLIVELMTDFKLWVESGYWSSIYENISLELMDNGILKFSGNKADTFYFKRDRIYTKKMINRFHVDDLEFTENFFMSYFKRDCVKVKKDKICLKKERCRRTNIISSNFKIIRV